MLLGLFRVGDLFFLVKHARVGDREKPGVDPAKGYHSGAHAVVVVSRGREDTQGEGGIDLAFFWSAKTVRRDQQ